MGYESTLLVVKPLRSLHHDGRTYASIVATIDLCVMPHAFQRRVRDRWEKNDLCVYMDGSDVSEDMYGDPLLAADLDRPVGIYIEDTAGRCTALDSLHSISMGSIEPWLELELTNEFRFLDEED